eukprot:g26527.t1
MILVAGGVVMAIGGRDHYRRFAFPLWFLVFMAPLPKAWYDAIAINMQQVASAVSATIFEICGIPVFREGCYIRIPNFQMEVGAACSGLRQLAAIVALSLAVGHLSDRTRIYKWALGLLSIPIAIGANCIRVTLTGFILMWFGQEWAEGVYHTLEGLAIVAVAAVLILIVAWWLSRFRFSTNEKGPTTPTDESSTEGSDRARMVRRPLLWMSVVIAISAGANLFVERRIAAIEKPEAVALRKPLETLPRQIGDWKGEDRPISEEAAYGDQHLSREYVNRRTGQRIRLWAIYSSRGLDRDHHPEVCMSVAGQKENRTARTTFDVPGHSAPVLQYQFQGVSGSQWNSRSRLIVRIFLFIVLFAVIGLAFYAWKRNRPEALWERSQIAVKNEDYDSAKITLQTLLQKEPEHVGALLALADIHRDEEAKKQNRSDATHAISDQAMEYLNRAARFHPEDPDVLKPLLRARLSLRNPADLREIATALLKHDPKNADALFALAQLETAAKNNAAAKKHLDVLMEVDGEPTVRTLVVAAKLAQQMKDDKSLQQALAAAIRMTADPERKFRITEVRYYNELHLAALKRAKSPAETDRILAATMRFTRLWASTPKYVVPAAVQALTLVSVAQKRQPYLASAEKKLRIGRKNLVDVATELGEAAVLKKNAPPQLEQLLASAYASIRNRHQTIRAAVLGLGRLRQRNDAPTKVKLALHALAANAMFELKRYASAREHIAPLMGDLKFAGTGHLLIGLIDADEGRLESARSHLESARRLLGSEHLAVRDHLGRVLARMYNWKEAVPYLASAAEDYDKLTSAQRDAILGFDKKLAQLRLLLIVGQYATGQSEAAESTIELLKGTRYETAGIVHRVHYLYVTKRKAEALRILNQSRTKFPEDLLLVQVDARLLLAEGKGDAADRLISSFAKARPKSIEAHYGWYSWLMYRRRFQQALELTESLQRQFPNHRFPTFGRAQTLLAMKDLDRAEKTVAELRKVPNMSSVASALAAEIAMRRNQFDAAANLLESAGFVERNDGRIDLLKGMSSLRSGDPLAAIDSLSEALSVTRRRAIAGDRLSSALRSLAIEQSAEVALQRLENALVKYPREKSLILIKAELQLRAGQFGQAMQTLKKLEREERRPANTIAQQAKLWAAIGRPADALAHANRALGIDPGNVFARTQAVNAANRLGRYDESLKHIEVLLKRNPNSVGVLIAKALALQKLKRRPEAVTFLEGATRQFPKSSSVWVALSGLHFGAGDSTKAAAILAEGRKHNPDSLLLVRESMNLALESGDVAAARKLATDIAGKQPTFGVAGTISESFLKRDLFASSREWAKVIDSIAEKTVDEAQQARALQARIDFRQGLVEENGSKYLENARDGYAELMKTSPDNPVYINNLAWLYANRLNDLPKARGMLEKLRKSTPVSRLPFGAVETLLSIYRKQGDLKSAIALVDEAVRTRPLESAWFRHKVDLALQIGRPESIVADLKRLHRERRWSPEPAYALARVYSVLGNRQAALAELKRALDADPGHQPSLNLAVTHAVKQNDPEAVVQNAVKALRRKPDQWGLVEKMATALNQLGRQQDADKLLTDALTRLNSRADTRKQPAKMVILARLQSAKGDSKQALETIVEGLKAFPHNSALVVQGVTLHLKQKQVAQATTFATQHLRQKADSRTLRAIAKMFYRAKANEPALLWAERAVKAADKSDEIAARLFAGSVAGILGREKKDRAILLKSRKHLELVLKLKPDHLTAINNLAWLLAHELDEPKEALKIVQRITSSVSVPLMNVGIIDTVAMVYRRNGQYLNARKILEEATSLHPRKAGLHFQLGLVYAQLDMPLDARRSLQQALRLGLEEEDRKLAEAGLKSIRKRIEGM